MSRFAQSPDLNVLDLGFFNSIQSLQTRTSPRTIAGLIDEVQTAFAATSTWTLNKTFLSLQCVMHEVLRRNGMNNFKPAHSAKERLMLHDKLLRSIACDTAAYKEAMRAVNERRYPSFLDPLAVM
ncbi:TPA: hypothetical protein N0F65_009072 [Lagenidium giganteum]|uniref:Uncharacterized protein n=1 Tax=Lagenidium giganteum TaxID=4803 RepID=A0AAV2YLJ4_9STRA|nr:TPA: hypothetical protein N0F65_009072 [Lagenidium giganteum]